MNIANGPDLRFDLSCLWSHMSDSIKAPHRYFLKFAQNR